MKITVGKLKQIIKEAVTSQFHACMYDLESEGCYWFVRGSEEQCNAAAQQMASVLGCSVITEDLLDNDSAEGDGCPIVLPAGHWLVRGSALSKVEAAPGDSYGGGALMFGYDDPEIDPIGFQPVEQSHFNPGDTLVRAQFVPSAPGGWVVTDLNMTRKEYWQEGTIENTHPDSYR